MGTLQDRKNKILRRMQADRIDKLVLAAGGRHMIDEADPITHLTGFLCVGPALVLLGSDGRVSLITAPSADAERVRARVRDAQCLPTDDLVGTFKDCWKNTRPGSLAAVSLTNLPWQLYAQLCAALGSEPQTYDEPFYAVSGPKTDQEIASARHASQIAEAALERLLTRARPGMKECDLGAELNLYIKSLGANDSFFMFNAGKDVPGAMPSSERRFEKGDLLLVELSPSCEGQFSQICRTISMGAPSADLVEKYSLLVTAMNEGIAQVRPGNKVSDVCAGVDARMEAAGFAKYSRPPYLKRRGHGLSCGTMSPGDIAYDNSTVLEPDMVFMVHPNQYLPGPGYMLCGEPVRVTTNGVEVLTKKRAALGVIDC